jgi:hypothetical protein
MPFLRFAAGAALCALLVPVAGCSLALKTDAEQCTTDADCAARGSDFAGTICKDNVCVEKPEAGPPPDPKWGCIGNVAPLMAGQIDTIKLQLLDLITQTPVQGLTVKVCNKYDPTCTKPLATPMPDAMGWVSASIASDLEAYLDISGGGYMPAVVFLDHVAAGKNTDILLITPEEVMGLAQIAKVTVDPTKGLVLGRTVDCTGTRTAGVSVTLSPSAGETRFYVINNTPTPNASQTDNGGNSGFVNVDPGNPSLTGTLGPDGKEMGKVTTLVRAGAMTYQLIRPTPTL